MPDMAGREIEEGQNVVTLDGIALGRVRRISGGTLFVGGSALVPGEQAVALDYVTGVFAGEVYLRKRAAEVVESQHQPTA